MKFWFTKRTPKDVYDGKAPFDATVEQVLRAVQEVNAAPVETEREDFDFAKALRPQPASAPATYAAALTPAASPPGRPAVSRATREEMERRIADYRAFQIRLNEEREARIRRTMDDVRAQLKRAAQDSSPR